MRLPCQSAHLRNMFLLFIILIYVYANTYINLKSKQMKRTKKMLLVPCVLVLLILGCKKNEVVHPKVEKLSKVVDTSVNNILIINAIVDEDPAITKFMGEYHNSATLQKQFKGRKIVLNNSISSQ